MCRGLQASEWIWPRIRRTIVAGVGLELGADVGPCLTGEGPAQGDLTLALGVRKPVVLYQSDRF